MSTLSARRSLNPLTRRDWLTMTRPERRRRVLELMQRRTEPDSTARDALSRWIAITAVVRHAS